MSNEKPVVAPVTDRVVYRTIAPFPILPPCSPEPPKFQKRTGRNNYIHPDGKHFVRPLTTEELIAKYCRKVSEIRKLDESIAKVDVVKGDLDKRIKELAEERGPFDQEVDHLVCRRREAVQYRSIAIHHRSIAVKSRDETKRYLPLALQPEQLSFERGMEEFLKHGFNIKRLMEDQSSAKWIYNNRIWKDGENRDVWWSNHGLITFAIVENWRKQRIRISMRL